MMGSRKLNTNLSYRIEKAEGRLSYALLHAYPHWKVLALVESVASESWAASGPVPLSCHPDQAPCEMFLRTGPAVFQRAPAAQ